MAVFTAIPFWLQLLADVYLAFGVASALYITYDILLRGHRMEMKIMNIVWPITAFYFGPVGLWAFWHIGHVNLLKIGKEAQEEKGHHHMEEGHHMEGASHKKGNYQEDTRSRDVSTRHLIAPHDISKGKKPFWETVFVSDTHCGAGCTIGDVVSEWIVYLGGTAILIAGSLLLTEYIFDFILAYALGIYFQFNPIKQMQSNLSTREALSRAIKADTISLVSFEVGLFGWMALMRFVFFSQPLLPNEPLFWFMMQIGMILGFWSSHLPNWWLVKKGIKMG